MYVLYDDNNDAGTYIIPDLTSAPAACACTWIRAQPTFRRQDNRNRFQESGIFCSCSIRNHQNVDRHFGGRTQWANACCCAMISKTPISGQDRACAGDRDTETRETRPTTQAPPLSHSLPPNITTNDMPRCLVVRLTDRLSG